MNEQAQALVEALQEIKPALNAWAKYVVEQIDVMLAAEIGAERAKLFFKIPPSYRIKDTSSAIQKQKRNGYKNPIEQMTDLAGARFVVLLRTDLEILENVILSHAGWTVSRERHYEHETNEDPEVFDYQSIHFLVKSSNELTRGFTTIPCGTICEVQIRTVLQHAYAELCHDKFYKPAGRVPPSARRIVARCMALMETTDLMFCEAVQEVEQASTSRQHWVTALTAEYTRTCRDYNGDSGLTERLVATFLKLLDGVKTSDVLAESLHPQIQARVYARSGSGLFGSPGSILCYWLVKNHHSQTFRLWPDESLRSDLALVCADLGFAD